MGSGWPIEPYPPKMIKKSNSVDKKKRNISRDAVHISKCVVHRILIKALHLRRWSGPQDECRVSLVDLN